MYLKFTVVRIIGNRISVKVEMVPLLSVVSIYLFIHVVMLITFHILDYAYANILECYAYLIYIYMRWTEFNLK